jgi:hypothetical protein
MDKVADVNGLDEGHLVHGRRHGRPSRVPLCCHTGDVVDKLHDHTAVHTAQQVRIENAHDPAERRPCR